MSEKKIITLTSPEGNRTWATSNAEELVNLRARGWSEKTEPETETVPALADEPVPQADEPAPPANKAVSSKSTK